MLKKDRLKSYKNGSCKTWVSSSFIHNSSLILMQSSGADFSGAQPTLSFDSLLKIS